MDVRDINVVTIARELVGAIQADAETTDLRRGKIGFRVAQVLSQLERQLREHDALLIAAKELLEQREHSIRVRFSGTPILAESLAVLQPYRDLIAKVEGSAKGGA